MELEDTRVRIEIMLKEHARIKWLKEGDKNFKFFHVSLRLKQSKNTYINILRQYNGDWRKVEERGKEYYEDLLTESLPTEHSHLFTVILKLLIEEENLELIRSLDKVEILETLKEMAQDSASGLNEFGANFYTFCWEIIQDNLCGTIKEFFNIGALPTHGRPLF